uniref:Scaffolding anchor of CK1 domain-containing protein n=1 Tax=Neogobius melanostomus TaxID=47308 RepID=A0A8C6U9U4_9GOBI
MDSSLSALSSLKDDNVPLYVQPHYKEAYRLAIYALLCGGTDAYEEFLRAEQISHFLSEQEIALILENAAFPLIEDEAESKADIPDLDLGWPDAPLEETDTSISVLFNPPRQDTPTIKEVVRKQIQDAVQLIAVTMDVFTDVDIFKELVIAALRGVVVYLLLDQTHFGSFLHMSQRLGVSLSEIKTIRVRTVKGLEYRCQSTMKLHGALEQKFILIDCRTVLYGSYSYTWTYEKLNLSMMLVITGQLVSSYDEEFRRLFARSTVPPLLSREKLQPTLYRHSPSSSQLSLHQLHMKNKAMNGIRDDRLNNNNMLTRGVSMQDRLHHFPDMGNLVKGHSYGGELQKLNSMARLRMGTKT